MDIHERLEAFWSGERPDVIPFTIYQNEWRHTQDDPAWIGLYKKGLGVTWHLRTTKEIWPNAIQIQEKSTRVNGKTFLRRSIQTPVGEIFELYEDDWRQKHYLETAQDYAVMTYVVSNVTVVPTYDEYLKMVDAIAPYGVGMAFTGRTPNQVILVDFVGLENYAFHLFDLESEMKELYEALRINFRRKVELVAEGPGRFVSVLENFTAETLGPKRFKELLVPVYEECFPILQGAGKIVGTHFDGQLASCKHLIAEAPIDLIESLTPPPEGDLTLKECREVWPDKLLWSNINVACYDLPPDELKTEVLRRVEDAAPDGRRFAFEVSEQYPENWKESLPVVLEALEETRAR